MRSRSMPTTELGVAYNGRPPTGLGTRWTALPQKDDDQKEDCAVTARPRLYEGRPLVKPDVRFLTPQLTPSPGERCRVKRLSKLTVSDHVGSWRLTRQREPGRK